MKAMSVKYKMLSDKNNIDNDRLYRPAALSELLEAWLAVFESRRPHRGDGKHNRQSPDTADTYQNWPGMINLSHRFTQIFTDFIWLTKTMKTPCGFVAVRPHKNQDKPLALDASLLRDLDGAAVWKSLSELRYFQPAIPSPYGFRINRKAINRK